MHTALELMHGERERLAADIRGLRAAVAALDDLIAVNEEYLGAVGADDP